MADFSPTKLQDHVSQMNEDEQKIYPLPFSKFPMWFSQTSRCEEVQPRAKVDEHVEVHAEVGRLGAHPLFGTIHALRVQNLVLPDNQRETRVGGLQLRAPAAGLPETAAEQLLLAGEMPAFARRWLVGPLPVGAGLRVFPHAFGVYLPPTVV